MTKPIKHIEKPWGYEEILENNPHYTVKKLFMEFGKQCSYQYHEKKHETVYVLAGNLTIITENSERIYEPGDFIILPPLTKHRMSAKTTDCLYLECSTSELDDVIRIEDDYGRN